MSSSSPISAPLREAISFLNNELHCYRDQCTENCLVRKRRFQPLVTRRYWSGACSESGNLEKRILEYLINEIDLTLGYIRNCKN